MNPPGLVPEDLQLIIILGGDRQTRKRVWILSSFR